MCGFFGLDYVFGFEFRAPVIHELVAPRFDAHLDAVKVPLRWFSLNIVTVDPEIALVVTVGSEVAVRVVGVA